MLTRIFKSCLGLGLVSLLVNSSLELYAVVDSRRSRVNLDVKEKKREKSTASSKNQLNRSAIFAVEVEEKLIKNIDATSAYLIKQANRMPKRSDGRLNLLEKAFNLNLEQAVYLRNQEERNYDDQWNSWDENGRKGREPKLNSNRSSSQWKEVANQAQAILTEFPKNKNADQIIFHQATALQYIGREKEAAQIFTKLIQNYPNSQIAGDAYASLGDYYFDRDDFRNATTNYKRALQYRRSKRYLWSVFKLGWSHYNLALYKDALRYWQQVVAIARTDASKENGRLKEEALRDMVFAFAELKDVDTAINYYRANGGTQYIGSFLRLLAQTFADQGQFALAIKTLRKFQMTVPNSPDAPEAEKEIINLAYELGQMKLVWEELEQFDNRYGANSSWAQANAEDKKLVLETQTMIKEQIIYYSKLTHKRAQTNDSVALHNEAKRGYLIFLKAYPTSKESVEVKYNIADIEYFLKNYSSEGRYLLEIALLDRDKAVIFDGKNSKPVNIHKEASLGMLRAFARDFDAEFKTILKRKPDFSKPPVPLSSKAQNYIKGCGLYSKWYPDDKKTIKVCDLDTTKIYFQSNDRKQAMKYLWFIANKYPNEKEGPDSVEQLIPLYKDNKPALLEVADRLLKIPAYQKGELGKKLMALRRGAEIEEIAKEKDALKRAEKYEAQAKKAPDDPEADKLMFNAAVDYVKAGAVPQALNAYMMVIRRYPKSSAQKDSHLAVAKLHEKNLEFASAASFYEVFAQKFPKEAEAPIATGKVCELQLVSEPDKAIESCSRFAKLKPDLAANFLLRLIRTLERAKKTQSMVDVIKKSYLTLPKMNPNDVIVAHYLIFKATKGSGTLASQAVKDILQTYDRNKAAISGEALRYVGEQYFRTAQNEIPKFVNMKLQGGTVDRLAVSIDSKAKALQSSKAAFDRVTATKDSYWGVAALHQIAFLHESFAKDLSAPPAIQGAKPEDVIKQLSPQVASLQKEAANWYKIAIDTVHQFKAYNEWGPRSLNGLARVSNNRLFFEDWIINPDFVGAEMNPQLVSTIREEAN